MTRGASLLLLLGLPAALAGCGALTKLSEIGGPPNLTPTSDPTRDPAWRPLTLPMPGGEALPPEPGTLWRSGSRAFFKDQRAARVGDLVTIVVNVTDAADVKDATQATRIDNENAGITNLFGLENKIPHIFSGATPASVVNTTSNNGVNGTAEAKRSETVTLRLAGVVTQVLPNGNLVVAARQEMRVNRELRVLTVTGVARPEDIASDNTIQHDRLAEARISYGGRGELTDVQAPRYGQELLDILLPF
jgi:flagellar L-ring protein precursor FlgH